MYVCVLHTQLLMKIYYLLCRLLYFHNFTSCRKKPVNAAVQYEAQVMSEDEATTIMESDSMVNFFKNTCPR